MSFDAPPNLPQCRSAAPLVDVSDSLDLGFHPMRVSISNPWRSVWVSVRTTWRPPTLRMAKVVRFKVDARCSRSGTAARERPVDSGQVGSSVLWIIHTSPGGHPHA